MIYATSVALKGLDDVTKFLPTSIQTAIHHRDLVGLLDSPSSHFNITSSEMFLILKRSA